jgi:hypothetical protein
MRHTYNTYGYTAKNEAGRLHRVTLKALNMVSDMRSRMASGFKAPHINQECSSSGAARSSWASALHVHSVANDAHRVTRRLTREHVLDGDLHRENTESSEHGLPKCDLLIVQLGLPK